MLAIRLAIAMGMLLLIVPWILLLFFAGASLWLWELAVMSQVRPWIGLLAGLFFIPAGGSLAMIWLLPVFLARWIVTWRWRSAFATVGLQGGPWWIRNYQFQGTNHGRYAEAYIFHGPKCDVFVEGQVNTRSTITINTALAAPSVVDDTRFAMTGEPAWSQQLVSIDGVADAINRLINDNLATLSNVVFRPDGVMVCFHGPGALALGQRGVQRMFDDLQLLVTAAETLTPEEAISPTDAEQARGKRWSGPALLFTLAFLAVFGLFGCMVFTFPIPFLFIR